MDENKKQRRDDVRSVEPLQWDESARPQLSDSDYTAMVKRYEDAGDLQNADIIRRQWKVAQCARAATAAPPVKAWRERIGLGADYPLHAPTDVERAMVAEIAELRFNLAHAAQRHDELIAHQAVKAMDLAEARAQLLDIGPDAERYRWLTSGWTPEELAEDHAHERQPADKPQLAVINQLALWYFAKDQIDALIDAAMAISGAQVEPKPAGGAGAAQNCRSSEKAQAECTRCPITTPYGPATCGKCMETDEQASQGAQQGDEAVEVARYRWLKDRFVGYDFYWGGNANAETEANKGRCVIVFECGPDFRADRDFEGAIDTIISSQADQKGRNNG